MSSNQGLKCLVLIVLALGLTGSVSATPQKDSKDSKDLNNLFYLRLADHHHDHGYNNGIYWGVGNGGFYFGNGPYVDPYYYPGYYYPNTYVVVEPRSSSGSSHHHAVSNPKPTAQGIQIMKAQVELTSQGYYTGAIDGILGSQTKAAITAYQHDKGLAETGQLNDATLKSLGVNKDN